MSSFYDLKTTTLDDKPADLSQPSVQPCDVTLSRSHTYGTACLYDLTFRSRDDDGGQATDAAVVIFDTPLNRANAVDILFVNQNQGDVRQISTTL